MFWLDRTDEDGSSGAQEDAARERAAEIERDQQAWERLLDVIAIETAGKPVEDLRAALGRVAREAARNPQMVRR